MEIPRAWAWVRSAFAAAWLSEERTSLPSAVHAAGAVSSPRMARRRAFTKVSASAPVDVSSP